MGRTRNLLDYQEHSKIQDLVHDLIKDSFTELTYASGKVSSVISYTGGSKKVAGGLYFRVICYNNDSSNDLRIKTGLIVGKE